MLAIGVELRSWATTIRAPLLSNIIHDVRHVYGGLLTYAANWDDVDDTVILGDLDVIGVNAFFPLSDRHGASFTELQQGGVEVARKMRELATTWQKPVMFTEVGYTTRKDAAIEPWTWPDTMTKVEIDQQSQAEAFAALLAPLLQEPWFAGFFVWRIYADPDDMSQEAEWGFSPRGKQAELVVRDAFSARWEADGPNAAWTGFSTVKASGIGSLLNEMMPRRLLQRLLRSRRPAWSRSRCSWPVIGIRRREFDLRRSNAATRRGFWKPRASAPTNARPARIMSRARICNRGERVSRDAFFKAGSVRPRSSRDQSWSLNACSKDYCPLLADKHLEACHPNFDRLPASIARALPSLDSAIIDYDTRSVCASYRERTAVVLSRDEGSLR